MGSYCTKRSKQGLNYSTADPENAYKDYQKRLLEMQRMKPV